MVIFFGTLLRFEEFFSVRLLSRGLRGFLNETRERVCTLAYKAEKRKRLCGDVVRRNSEEKRRRRGKE